MVFTTVTLCPRTFAAVFGGFCRLFRRHFAPRDPLLCAPRKAHALLHSHRPTLPWYVASHALIVCSITHQWFLARGVSLPPAFLLCGLRSPHIAVNFDLRIPLGTQSTPLLLLPFSFFPSPNSSNTAIPTFQPYHNLLGLFEGRFISPLDVSKYGSTEGGETTCVFGRALREATPAAA
jgi:hypothetical protein